MLVQVLIDTWWNVNKFSNASFLHAKRVLIDTWWNVNTLLHEPLFRTDHVLIDTWWNVNVLPKTYAKIFDEVLIDTWWNVNDFGYLSKPRSDSGFNRYMVECESLPEWYNAYKAN